LQQVHTTGLTWHELAVNWLPGVVRAGR
jgi:hypothetical protein